MGRISLFSEPESVLIKTTLVKSLQRHCGQLTDHALIKTSMDNPAEEIRFLEVQSSGSQIRNYLISYRPVRIITVNTTPANPYLVCVTFQEPELQLPPSLQNPAHQLVAVDTKVSNKYEFKMAKF